MRRRPSNRHFIAGAAVLITLSTGCGPGAPAPPPFPDDTPRLVLFLVIDQMSQEYLVRFRPLLDGGFDYLLENGVVFADAHHDHAHTVTGAGHATLASGRFPRHSGIVSNQWVDRATGEDVYCVQGRDYRRSPANLLVDTVADWIKERDPASKVFAASGKDRSAVLTGGHGADAALWYDGGKWATTGYYTEPEWLDGFNARNWLDQYFGRTWEPLPVPQETLTDLGIVELDEGIYQRSFPYAFGSKTLAPTSGFYSAILSSPLADDYLLELAKTILEEEGLGDDEHPDFLGLGFSALDYVGHNFGPNSREVLDTILRLDDALAELFAAIDARVGLENVVISLSADHGVAPLPAYRRANGQWAEREDMQDVACYQDAGRRLKDRFGDYQWLRDGLYLNEEAIEATGIDRGELDRAVVELLGMCDAVERVWTRSELLEAQQSPSGGAGGPTDEERYRRLFANGYHPDRSPDYEIQYRAYYLERRSAGTSHGSPHPYDTWVPLIVVAPGAAPHEEPGRVITADLAPTLAGILGIEPPADLDGVDRSDRVGGW